MPLIDTVWLRTAQWLALLLLVVAGCANPINIGPTDTGQPPPPFSDSGTDQQPERWWTAFNDPELDQQINQAFESNYSLAAAMQRVRTARALTRREASSLFPAFNGIADIGTNFGPGPNQSTYTFALDGSFQVDLWGQIESRVQAERLRTEARCADYHALAITLSADIARTWYSLIEANAQVELLKEQIQTNRDGLIIQESRFALGLIRSADVLRQRQLLESTLEQAVVADQRIETLEHQLAVLLGQMPQSASFNPGATLPDLPPLPEAGLPIELIRRRPDVRGIFLAMNAANRDVASAISAQYPRFNLSGSVLTAAENPETLLKDWFASIGGQLIAPLLDGGLRRSEVERTSALLCELFNQYKQTVLIAFREVEDSLAQEKYQLRRIEHIKEQVKLAVQSYDQLRGQYLIGDAEYLDVLSAIQAQQSLQRQLLSAQLELVLIRISLYVALSGDFDPCQPQLQVAPGAPNTGTGTVPESDEPDANMDDPQVVDLPPLIELRQPDIMEEGPTEPKNNE
jgi:NodT family efflux transporter outer membrane factor (OMF) lipoprotein